MRPNDLWKPACLIAILAAFGCGGGGTSADADADTDADVEPDGGEADARPDTTPDGEPDGSPDGEPDGSPDVEPDVRPDGDGRDGDVRPDGRDDGGGEGGGGDGGSGDGSGGCDPTMCYISCLMSGGGSGECVADSCVCGDGGTGDGGSGDGGTGDGSIDIPFDVPLDGFPEVDLDGGLPEFGGEAFDFSFPDGFDGLGDMTPESSMDTGGACDNAACMAACTSAGHTFGVCDMGGSCLCF